MRSFPAEYISHDGDIYYFNIDLGFERWYVAQIHLTGVIDELAFGDKVMLRVQKVDRRPSKYIGYMATV